MGDQQLEDTRNRTQVSSDAVASGVDRLNAELIRRLHEKGFGTFASKHEIMGVMLEEWEEVKLAVGGHGTKDELVSELYDLAVAAVFGAVCIEYEFVDW